MRSNNYFSSYRVNKEFLNQKIKMDAIASFSVAHDRLADLANLYIPEFKRILGNHFDYWLKAENLIRSSPYSWVASREKLERFNKYFPSYRVNKNFRL